MPSVYPTHPPIIPPTCFPSGIPSQPIPSTSPSHDTTTHECRCFTFRCGTQWDGIYHQYGRIWQKIGSINALTEIEHTNLTSGSSNNEEQFPGTGYCFDQSSTRGDNPPPKKKKKILKTVFFIF